jgi:uncharacterized LabA/DUF88 family protein
LKSRRDKFFNISFLQPSWEVLMSRTALFIDAAYFEKLAAGDPIDFVKLFQRMADSHELLRSYFYDALPYLPKHPSDDALARYDNKQRHITAVNRLPRSEVRLGRTEYRGCVNGKPVFVQKRVDVLMAVDMAVLATKHLITDAAVIAGDSDFIPAIEAAKAEGVSVHLYHGLNAHDDLIEECDERTLITDEFIYSVSRQRLSLMATA